MHIGLRLRRRIRVLHRMEEIRLAFGESRLLVDGTARLRRGIHHGLLGVATLGGGSGGLCKGTVGRIIGGCGGWSRGSSRAAAHSRI